MLSAISVVFCPFFLKCWLWLTKMSKYTNGLKFKFENHYFIFLMVFPRAYAIPEMSARKDKFSIRRTKSLCGSAIGWWGGRQIDIQDQRIPRNWRTRLLGVSFLQSIMVTSWELVLQMSKNNFLTIDLIYTSPLAEENTRHEFVILTAIFKPTSLSRHLLISHFLH